MRWIILLTSLAVSSLLAIPAMMPAETIYAPYLDFACQPHFDLVKLSQQSGAKQFRLGFIVQNRHVWRCDPAWGGYNAYAISKKRGLDDIKKFQAAGGKVTLSFGGEAGIYLSQRARSASELATAYQKIIDCYQVYSLDFDIENAHLHDKAALTRQMEALQKVQSHYRLLGHQIKVSLTLPSMPSGMMPQTLRVVELAQQHGVDVYRVNIMAMDYDSVSYDPKKMGTYAIDAAKSVHQQLQKLYSHKSSFAIWQMIGLTPMIGMNDAYPERFSLADARLVSRFAKENHLGLISDWAINRDCPGIGTHATERSSGSFRGQKMQRYAYDYSKIFITT